MKIGDSVNNLDVNKKGFSPNRDSGFINTDITKKREAEIFPDEILLLIYQYLNQREQSNFNLVDREWNYIGYSSCFRSMIRTLTAVVQKNKLLDKLPFTGCWKLLSNSNIKKIQKFQTEKKVSIEYVLNRCFHLDPKIELQLIKKTLWFFSEEDLTCEFKKESNKKSDVYIKFCIEKIKFVVNHVKLMDKEDKDLNNFLICKSLFSHPEFTYTLFKNTYYKNIEFYKLVESKVCPISPVFLDLSYHKLKSYFEILGSGSCFFFNLEPMQKDRDVVLASVLRDGLFLKYADKVLQADREIVYEAFEQNEDAIRFVLDREFVIEKVKENPFVYQILHEKMKKDRDIAFLAINLNNYILNYVHDDLLKDKLFIDEAIKINPHATYFKKV